jgi:hypothetical protein
MHHRLTLSATCSGSRVRVGSPPNAATLLNSTCAAGLKRERLLDVRQSLTSDPPDPATIT